MDSQRRATQRLELQTLRDEAAILSRRHNELFAAAIVGPTDLFSIVKDGLILPSGLPEDQPVLVISPGQHPIFDGLTLLAGDRDDLEAFDKFARLVIAARIGQAESNAPPDPPASNEAASLLACRIVGMARNGVLSLPCRISPYDPRELQAIRRFNAAQKAGESTWEMQRLAAEVIEATETADAKERVLSYSLEVPLFRGMISFLNWAAGMMESEDANASTVVTENRHPIPRAWDDTNLVTLQDIVDYVQVMRKRTIRNRINGKGGERFPEPVMPGGGGGKADRWYWPDVRTYFIKHAGVPPERLAENFPKLPPR